MDKQQHIDHLAIMISNYVALSDIGADNLDVLEKIFEKLNISPNLENWWRNRFEVAKRNIQKGFEDGTTELS